MQQWIQKYMVNTNIWVAICFTAFLAFFQLHLYEINSYVLGIAFFGTITIYNFTRVTRIKDFWEVPKSNRAQVLLTYFGILLTLICVILRGFELRTFMYLGFLGMLSFCYSLPFKNLGLRTVPFLKLFLIAFVWAGSSVGLLLVVHYDLVNYQYLMVAIGLFVIGITLPFDIRDKLTDNTNLKTIPQIIGFKKSKVVSVFSIILSGVFFYLEFLSFTTMVVQWWLAMLIPLFLILKTKEESSHFYFSFWIEGCSMIPLLMYGIYNCF